MRAAFSLTLRASTEPGSTLDSTMKRRIHCPPTDSANSPWASPRGGTQPIDFSCVAPHSAKGVLDKDCFVRVTVDMPDPGTGPLQPYQLRVLEEKQDLDMRIARLDEFAQRNPAFLVLPDAERERLNRQLDAQRALSAILGERIQAWEGVAQ